LEYEYPFKAEQFQLEESCGVELLLEEIVILEKSIYYVELQEKEICTGAVVWLIEEEKE
jgi:hypothetical protein